MGGKSNMKELTEQEIKDKFEAELIGDMVDLDPEISEAVSDNLDELI